MTWAVSLIGRPQGISAELDRYGETLDPQSRAEFEAAKAHLQVLVSQNFNRTEVNGPIVHLEASGQGQYQSSGMPGRTGTSAVIVGRTCTVSVRVLPVKLV